MKKLTVQDQESRPTLTPVVRYSVLYENEQLFACKYKLVLPSEDELRAELKKEQLWLTKQGKAAK